MGSLPKVDVKSTKFPLSPFKWLVPLFIATKVLHRHRTLKCLLREQVLVLFRGVPCTFITSLITVIQLKISVANVKDIF